MSVPETSQSFDYIIVGGGTSGLALAGRLTENSAVHVCVLEAGEDVSSVPEIIVPGLSFQNMGALERDWGLFSSPQTSANNRKVHLLRGKGLGGSSNLNFMEMARGHAEEYNAFEALGATGWNWPNLLEYFKQSETFTVTEKDTITFGVKTDASTDGTSGPIQRTMSKWISDMHVPFQDTMISLGIPFNPNSGYYEPNKARPNLRVFTGVMVTRILLEVDEATGDVIAKGVEYRKEGVTSEVSSTREVILCAGSFQTPQLLELSGIGNKDILASHGIKTLVDLPGVGENLREYGIILVIWARDTHASSDHFWCSLTMRAVDSCETLEILQDADRAASELRKYQEEKAGMFSTSASTTFAMLPTTDFADNQEILRTAAEGIKGTDISVKALDIQKSWLFNSSVPHVEFAPFPGFLPAPGKSPEAGKRYFSFLIALLHPFSRGVVHIGSSDPLQPPIIDPRMLNNDLDLEIMVQAFKFARKVAATEPLANLVEEEIIPGSEAQTDGDIKEIIRNTIQTVYHPLGTAAMLPRDELGVVDTNLKVYGTKNLRVVDASVIPIQVSAPTQSTVYALAEKAASTVLMRLKVQSRVTQGV